AVRVIPGSHRPLGDVLPGALAQRLDVGEERAATRFAHFVVLAVEPVADLRSDEAYFALMSALALSYFALTSFSQALSSLPSCAPVEGDCAWAAPANASATAAAMLSSLVCIVDLRSLRPSQQARNQRNQEKDHENDEQNLRDFRRPCRDAGEAEDRSDDGDDE